MSGEAVRLIVRKMGAEAGIKNPVRPHGLRHQAITSVSQALDAHELIKVKFRGAEREERDAGLVKLATATESVLVHRIGHTALYYKRRNDRPGIVIPDA